MNKGASRIARLLRKFSLPPPLKTTRNNIVRLAFNKYLLVTNTVTSGVLMFVGDLIQQEFEYHEFKKKKRYDLARLARMFVYGLGKGPLDHYFYKYLHVILPTRDLRTTLKKILLDQLIMSPVFIAHFFYLLGLLEMRSLEDITKEFKAKFVVVYTVDWFVWPPTQFINFYVVPVQFQVLYINGIAMAYNIFLSYIKHRTHHTNLSETNHDTMILQAKH